MNVAFANDNRLKNKFSEKIKVVFNKLKNLTIPNYVYYFLILMAIGLGFYFIMLVENGFSLAYGGDYSAQYIPMGYHVWDYYHDWIRTGHFTLFDQSIYLGVNSIGSNAYYGLFSPFNIITIILPRSFVPQSMAICSIVKLACAGFFFSLYMKKAFDVKDVVARTCGIAYAFAGWGAFYLWYNNYQDILVFFPLVLLGIERVLKDYKPWTLCTGVFFLAICNYVLAVPYIICAFIYAMFRFFQKIRTKTAADNFKTLGFGFVGFAGGLLMSMLIFGPAIMATINSPKLDSYSYFGQLKAYLSSGQLGKFFELLLSWNVVPDQHSRIIPNRVFYPILEFFFPATTCRTLPTIQLQFWDFDDFAVSLWCYVPFILFLVPALIQSGKEKKWSHFIAFTLFVISLFTPFMYFLTMGFTNGYARWTLFVATSLIAYVGIYLNKIPNVAKWHIHVGFAFAVIGIVITWLLTTSLTVKNVNVEGKFMRRLIEYDFNFDFTHLAFILELCYTLGVYLTFVFIYHKKAFHTLTAIFVSFEAVVMGNLVTWGHGYDTTYNNGYTTNERFKSLLNKVTKGDNSFYRIYSSIDDDWSVNNAMMNNYSSAGYFHSLYNFEVNNFTLWTGLRVATKDVGGIYRGKYQDLDNLLGVKYYFLSKAKTKYYSIEANNPNGYIGNVPFDFVESTKYDKEKSEYIVYENSLLNDFGYSYSSFYSGNMYYSAYSVDSILNSILLSKHARVSEDDQNEILSLYPTSFTTTTERDGLNVLEENTDYTRKFYDITALTNDAAKNYPFDQITSISDLTEAEYTRYTSDNKSRAQRYFAIYQSPDDQPLFSADTAMYAQAPFSPSQKYDFYFIDEDNKIFMYDMHDDDTTDNTSQMRGFYIRKNVKYLAICGKYDDSFLDSFPTMYTEPRANYEARRAALSANPIENVKYSKDKFTFTTNYTDERFVVSRVAYDKGWKITAKDSDGNVLPIKIYNGNGAFVSFVAPKGNISYTMTYVTPYLTISYIVSALSITSFFISMVGYTIYQNNKKKHYLDLIYRENY